MVAVREIFSSLAVPVGLPKNVRPRQKDIARWKKEENPNFFQKSSLITLSSIGLGIASIGIGLLSAQKDYEFGKLLSCLGIAASLGGIGADTFLKKQDPPSVVSPPSDQLENQSSKDVYEIVLNPRGLFGQRTSYDQPGNGSSCTKTTRPAEDLRHPNGRLYDLLEGDHWLN